MHSFSTIQIGTVELKRGGNNYQLLLHLLGCTVNPTIHSYTLPFRYSHGFGDRFGPSNLFVDQCESLGPPSNYYITDNDIANAYIVIDTGCHNSFMTTIELKNVHNGFPNE